MPRNANIDIEGVMVPMQLDTGASLSLMAETTFREHWPQSSLSSSQVRVCFYLGEALPVLGAVDVNVTYKGQSHKVPVKGSGLTLIGCNWLDWQENFLCRVRNSVSPMQQILQKHSNVFKKV